MSCTIESNNSINVLWALNREIYTFGGDGETVNVHAFIWDEYVWRVFPYQYKSETTLADERPTGHLAKYEAQNELLKQHKKKPIINISVFCAWLSKRRQRTIFSIFPMRRARRRARKKKKNERETLPQISNRIECKERLSWLCHPCNPRLACILRLRRWSFNTLNHLYSASISNVVIPQRVRIFSKQS